MAILSVALDAGINVIDTANQYGGHRGVGTTQTLVGKWLVQVLSGLDKIDADIQHLPSPRLGQDFLTAFDATFFGTGPAHEAYGW